MFSVRLKQVLFAAAIVALAGCSSQSMTAAPPAVPASHAVAPAPAQMLNVSDDVATVTKHVGVRLTGEASFNSPTYGKVLGYFNGKTSTNSEVVKLPAATVVVFNNVDTIHPHTASFLGDATSQGANWPTSFNGSSQASPAGTAIGTASFSTGAMSPGTHSKKYNSGSPGFYMFGCAFHYNAFGMRTVIIVM